MNNGIPKDGIIKIPPINPPLRNSSGLYIPDLGDLPTAENLYRISIEYRPFVTPGNFKS